MSIEAALLAAVCAAPDDDLPRLVYADWCDEQGRHLRADFIRSQIELTRLEEWFQRFTTREERKANGPEFGRRMSFLRKRVGQLLNHHYDEAVGVPASWHDHFITRRDLSVRRGFIEGLDSIGPTEVKHLPEIISALAGLLPEVRVSRLEGYLSGRWPSVSDPFIDPAGWEWVTSIHPHGKYWNNTGHPLAPEGVSRLSDLPLVRLRRLDLRYWQLTDSHARVLAERFDLPALRELDLVWNRLTPAGVRSLSEAPWWTGLHELSLSCSPSVRELVEVLTTTRIPRLQSLTLGNNHELSGRVGELLRAELAAAYPNTVIDIT